MSDEQRTDSAPLARPDAPQRPRPALPYTASDLAGGKPLAQDVESLKARLAEALSREP